MINRPINLVSLLGNASVARLVVLTLLLVVVGLGSLLLIWQLLHTWRRHNRRHQQGQTSRRRPAFDIWQAGGDRLKTPSPESLNSTDEPPTQPEGDD